MNIEEKSELYYEAITTAIMNADCKPDGYALLGALASTLGDVFSQIEGDDNKKAFLARVDQVIRAKAFNPDNNMH